MILALGNVPTVEYGFDTDFLDAGLMGLPFRDGF